MLVAGTSAIAYGVLRKDGLRWPMLLGGAALVGTASAKSVPREMSCEVSCTINCPASEIYSFLRDSHNWIDQFAADNRGNQSATSASLTLTGEQPDQSLNWKSGDGRRYDVILRFQPAPGNRGTEVHAHVRMPSATRLIAELFHSAAGQSLEQRTRESLRHAKQLLEAGEIATTDGQPHGTRGFKGKMQRAMLRENAAEKRPQQGTGPNRDQELAAS
jgi:uncharacterized membrane protein